MSSLELALVLVLLFLTAAIWGAVVALLLGL